MKNKAFTLIELMIVIAIVAILSGMAISYYGTNRARAQISSVLPVISKLRNQAIEYYVANGAFPDANHLGLDSPQAQLNDPTVLSPYLSEVYIISPVYNNEGYTCTSGYGEMLFYFDRNQIGIDDDGFDLGIFIYYGDINGTIVSTAADSTDSGTEFVQDLINSEFPTRQALFNAAGCS